MNVPGYGDQEGERIVINAAARYRANKLFDCNISSCIGIIEDQPRARVKPLFLLDPRWYTLPVPLYREERGGNFYKRDDLSRAQRFLRDVDLGIEHSILRKLSK